MLYLIANLKYLKGSDTYKLFSEKVDIPVDSLQSYFYERRSPTINVVIKLYEYFYNEGKVKSLDEFIFKDLSNKSKEMR